MTTRDPRDLGRDWIALWQSELAALAQDREAQETMQALAALWAGTAGALLAAMPDGLLAPGPGRPAAPPGAAPAAAAHDPGHAELHARIAELERRLAELERGRG